MEWKPEEEGVDFSEAALMPDHERRARGFVGAAKRLIENDYPELEMIIRMVGDEADLYAEVVELPGEDGDAEGVEWAQRISDQIDRESAVSHRVTAKLYGDEVPLIGRGIDQLDRLAGNDEYRGHREADAGEIRENQTKRALRKYVGQGVGDYPEFESPFMSYLFVREA